MRKKGMAIVAVATMVLMGLMVMVNPIAAVDPDPPTLNKYMEKYDLALGLHYTVYIKVCIDTGDSMTYKVTDEIPNPLMYVKGTFMVDGKCKKPCISNGVISTLIKGEGCHLISYDIWFNTAPAVTYVIPDICAHVYDKYCTEVAEDCICLEIKKYCGLYKYFLDRVDEDGDGAVEVGEEVSWTFVLTMSNIYWGQVDVITDVIVKDNFGGELENDNYPDDPDTTKGTATIKYKGATQKMQLFWEIGDLESGDDWGETATLTMPISTDMNPGGNQEYTSPGIHYLNSGCVAKFKINGVQVSAHFPQFTVYVYEPN